MTDSSILFYLYIYIYFKNSHLHPNQYTNTTPSNSIQVKLHDLVHVFENRQSMEVSLTVTDSGGSKGSDMIRVRPLQTVDNTVPIASFTANKVKGNPPLNIQVNAAQSSDADSGIYYILYIFLYVYYNTPTFLSSSLDYLKYSWSWGDGKTGSGVQSR